MPENARYIGTCTDAFGQVTMLFVHDGHVLVKTCNHVRHYDAAKQDAFARLWVRACWEAAASPLVEVTAT